MFSLKYILFITLGGFGPNHCYVEAGEHEYRLTQYLMSSYEVNHTFEIKMFIYIIVMANVIYVHAENPLILIYLISTECISIKFCILHCIPRSVIRILKCGLKSMLCNINKLHCNILI